MKPLIISFISLLFAFSGCTTITVRPIDSGVTLKHVCIKENPQVTIPGFITVLEDGFDRHGISTQIFSGPPPAECEYILTYTALRSWDFKTYLTEAELRLEKDGKRVGAAQYHLKGKGGLSLVKWSSVKSKMNPVIDELLKNY